ncbi:aspartic proteinase nepenthesin-1-like [Silene latifolia]|uniref:aspartic proteinase nepenthesin-1-like n=1 Tax=Silene latifolia TaxID=37657 RepID=UPI003D76B271
MSNVQKLILFLYLIDIGIISFISSTNGFSMRMVPINSHHLKIVPEKFTTYERLQFFNNITMSRMYNRRKHLFPDGIKSPLSLVQNTVFVTELHLGEGDTAYSPYVNLDTGSEVTWVQCEGCDPCFELDKSFAYKKSTSFTRVSIYDEMCSPPESYDGSCGFSLLYGDMEPHLEAEGLIGRETFYFENSRTNNMDAYQGLVFGCTLKSKYAYFGSKDMHENVVAGIFGLTGNPRSLLTQLDAQTHGRFFYCIPHVTDVTFIESTIYFGDDAQITGDATRQVQTIPMQSGIHYYLPLSGISVNKKRLPIDPSIFEYVEGDYTKGFLIDSGSAFSALPKSAYNLLRQAIVKFFRDAYGWLPRRPGLVFDLCYAIYPHYDQNLFPNVILHFLSNDQVGEIDMVLTKEHLFTEVENSHGEEQGFCMMILAGDDPGQTLLGSFQQVNFGFLYDVHNNRLSFVPQNCLENIS